VPVVSADTLTACEGVPVQLHASGGQNAAFSWSPAAGLDSPSIPNPVATPATTTTYLLSMEEGGCITQVPLTLTILPSPKVEAFGSNPAGCIPFPVHFLESSHTNLAYAWDFGDGSPVSNEPSPSHTYLRPGTYPVVLTGTNTGGCSGKSTPIMVIVADTLHPDFTLAAAGMAPSSLFPLVLELPDAIAEVHNTSVGPATDWAWDFGDGEISHELNAIHAYAQAGMYMVTLRSVNPEGCVSRLVKGPVIVLAPDLFIPNVFTPNGDGIGDAFLVEYAGSQPFELKVYDRWGASMYISQNKLAGWDGQTMQGQKVPEGTYYYALSIGKKDYSGSLTLMR
jgi:gliding motility-associated-like protein